MMRNERVPFVKEFLEDNPSCQRCGKPSQTVHEKLTRARGGDILDKNNCVALCQECHQEIHLHPRQATEDGWLIRRAVPQYRHGHENT